MSWLDDAACNGVDTDVFVVIGGGVARNQNRANRARLANALTYCHNCPTVTECRAYMLGWDTPPRDIVIAALDPRTARLAWHSRHPNYTRHAS